MLFFTPLKCLMPQEVGKMPYKVLKDVDSLFEKLTRHISGYTLNKYCTSEEPNSL